MANTLRYTTEGQLRGKCGHKHRNLDGAIDCLDEDEALCAARGGHSDRKILALAAGVKRELNEDELAAAAAYRKGSNRSTR